MNSVHAVLRSAHPAFEVIHEEARRRTQRHSMHRPIEVQLEVRRQLTQTQLALQQSRTEQHSLVHRMSM